MKQFLFIALIFTATACFAQKIDILKIDLGKNITSLETPVEKGEYAAKIVNIPNNSSLEIKVEKGTIRYGKFSLTATDEATVSFANRVENDPYTYPIPGILTLSSNTKYTVSIKVTDKNNSENVTEYKYVFKHQSSWEWSATYGVNSVFLVKNDTYKTLAQDDQYTIVRDGSQRIINYIPSVMFTFMNPSQNAAFGFTGGLGFDLETISVFTGLSLGIGQNIILTGGVAFHKQDRLDSKFNPGQLIDDNMNFDDLHSQYYRFNPFISISFNLDKSLFKRE